MTSYLLGIQWENSFMHLACVRRTNSGKTKLISVTTLAVSSFKDWLKEHIPQTASVQAVLTVPESHIILKELELPVLKPAELAEAVHWELTEKSSAGPESVVSWQTVEKRDGMLRVAAMIMKKTEVAAAVSFFTEAGIELTAIEPSSISSGRILSLPMTTSILLSLEGAEVSAVFVRARVPVFSTSFSIPLTNSAVRAKHLPRDAAASLVSQLKRITAYWNSKDAKVEHVIVVGDAAGFSGIKSDVARGIDIPIVPGEVKRDVSVKTKPVSPGMIAQYAPSIGAAIRLLTTDAGDIVNFLPKENRISLEKKAFSTYIRMRLWHFVKINVVILVMLATLSVYLWILTMTYKREIAQTERFVSNHPAQKYVSHITSVNTLAKDVATLMTKQEDTGARLRYLSSVTPPNIHYTSLKMAVGTGQEWLVTGSGDRTDILAFYYKLKTDKTVSDVSMPYSNFNKETDSTFSISIVW